MENINILPSRVYTNPYDSLQIVGAILTISENFSVALDLLNTGDTTITGVYFSISFKAETGGELLNGVEFDFSQTNIEIPPHSLYFVKQFPLDERFNEARGIEAGIVKYTTSNSTVVATDRTKQKLYTLPIITKEKHDKMRYTLGEDIITYGENLIESWRCVCGALNGKNTEECTNCGRSKIFVLNNLTEPLINLKLISSLSGDEDLTKELTRNITRTLSSQKAQETKTIDESRINENIQSEKKKLSIISTVAVSIVLLIAVVFAYNNFAKKFISERNIKSVELYLEEGEYEKAREKLQSLTISDPESKESKLREIDQLISSDKSYSLGLDMEKNQDYFSAVSYFKEVSEEDTKNYRSAQAHIANLELEVVNSAQNKINEGSYSEAQDILNGLLKVMPESAKATNLIQSISMDMEEEMAEGEDGADNSVDDKDRTELVKKANALLYSYQKVKVKGGNLRRGPGLEYGEVVKLPIDSDVYIYEVKIEEDKRIWCKVEARDFDTEKIYDGWISHKILEEEKK